MQKEKRKNISRNWILAYITAALLVGGVVGFVLGLVLPARETEIIMVTSQPIPTPTAIHFVQIVVAFQSIPCGAAIPEDAVALFPWIQDAAPVTSIDAVESVVGRFARIDIPSDMPILSGMLVDNPELLPETCKAE